MNIALDSNAYSDWRRTGQWGELISRAIAVSISPIVLGELRDGFRAGKFEDENERLLQRFLSSPAVEQHTLGEATRHQYARLKNHLRQQGTPIPTNDIWIAACCIEHGCTLLTSDKHFERLPQVSVAPRED